MAQYAVLICERRRGTGAWLTTVARRRALDVLRRGHTLDANEGYRAALALGGNAAERDVLADRVSSVGTAPPG